MKLSILKIAYLLFVVIIISSLVCELYLIIDRRLANQQVKQSKIYKNNIFTQKPENFMESLWEIPWEKYRANSVTEGIIGGERMKVKINSHGFRTEEFEIEKPKGIYRIICIGASTTFQGLTNNTTYPALLEKILEKRYPDHRFEVLNFGISGSNSDYWISRLDDFFKFQPDLVIQYNAVNDISHLYMYRQNNNCANEIKYLWKKAGNYSFLFQKLFPLDPSFMDDCFMTTFQNFNQIASEAKSRDINYIVGTFAAPNYSKATKILKRYLDYNVQKTWGKGLNLKYYSSYYNLVTRFNTYLKYYAGQHNINIVSVDSFITDPNLFTDITHANSEGIGKLADAFSKGIFKILDKKLHISKENQ
jgi:lysophospholipase L1-like esterase